MAETVKPRLRVRYEQEIIPALEKEFGYKNVNQVPKMEKIVLNMGLGDVKDVAARVGIDVTDVNFWRKSLSVVEKMIDEMEKLA